jgi:hypothetical protein
MRLGPFVALALLPAAAAAQPSREESLRAFMAASFAEIRASAPDATYAAAFADLNGDGRDEAIVWQSANFFCGSGGCGLYIYTPEGETWREIDDLTVIGEPVLMLDTTTRGWRDLALIVRDGGMDLPYQVRLRFDGRSYANRNEVRLPRGRRLDGRILIGEGMSSRRLFP